MAVKKRNIFGSHRIGKKAYYAIEDELKRVQKEIDHAKDDTYKKEMRSRKQGIEFVLNNMHIYIRLQPGLKN